MCKAVDKVAIVLGGGGVSDGASIGEALCLAYAASGAFVIVADISHANAERTVQHIHDLGHSAEATEVDVAQAEQVDHLCSRVIEKYGRIDILHCNVGIGKSGESARTTPDEWRQITEVNLTSVHVATQAVLPTMRTQGSGVILLTSSVMGMFYAGYPHLAYGVTKAGVIQFTRLLAVENAQYGVRVNCVVPGLIDTPRIRHTLTGAYGSQSYSEMLEHRAKQVPLLRLGIAQDVARAAAFLASEDARYITGVALPVDGGLHCKAG